MSTEEFVRQMKFEINKLLIGIRECNSSSRVLKDVSKADVSQLLSTEQKDEIIESRKYLLRYYSLLYTDYFAFKNKFDTKVNENESDLLSSASTSASYEQSKSIAYCYEMLCGIESSLSTIKDNLNI